MGRDDEARAEFARAAQLTRNKAERNLFLTRAHAPSRQPE
jgi:predicted RNA polymerase sigma factor